MRARIAAAAASALVFSGTGIAYVTEAHADPTVTVTVDGRDYPVCEMEDCSDQPGQIGVWYDPDGTGAWLSLGEDRSVHITPAPGSYVPGCNPLDVMTGAGCTEDAYAREVGDDNADGIIAVGESGFGFDQWREHVPGDWTDGRVVSQ